MCKALPYPRCTSHARANLTEAQEAYQSAENAYNAVKNGRASQKKDEALDDLEQAHMELKQAEREYYSSPGGMKELQQRLESGSLDEDEQDSVRILLDIAQMDRDSRLLAGIAQDRLKDNVSGKDMEYRSFLVSQETKVNKALGMATDKQNPRTERLRRLAARTRLERRQHEERIRRQSAGLSKTTVSTVDRVTGQDDAFLHLQPSSFGQMSTYHPFGAYSKITAVRPQKNGYMSVCLENKVWVSVPKTTKATVSTK